MNHHDSFGIDINNYQENGYEVDIDRPNPEAEPDFYVVKLKFPIERPNGRSYGYTSVLYSSNGDRMLSYRPENNASSYSAQVELVLVAHHEVLACMSIVSHFYKSDSENWGFHPPMDMVSLDIQSFFPNMEKCPDLDWAGNYW